MSCGVWADELVVGVEMYYDKGLVAQVGVEQLWSPGKSASQVEKALAGYCKGPFCNSALSQGQLGFVWRGNSECKRRKVFRSLHFFTALHP